MRKVIFIIMFLFVFSVFSSNMVMAKDTTKTLKKLVKKNDKKVKDPIVYIRDNGKKFHKRNCKLVSGKKGIKLSEAIAKGYKPCKVCFQSELVYVTDKGTKYHKKSCKLIKDMKGIQIGIAKLKGYESCKICFPPKKDKDKKDIKKIVKSKSKK